MNSHDFRSEGCKLVPSTTKSGSAGQVSTVCQRPLKAVERGILVRRELVQKQYTNSAVAAFTRQRSVPCCVLMEALING